MVDKKRSDRIDKEIKEIISLCTETKENHEKIKTVKFLASVDGVPFSRSEIKKVTMAIDKKCGHVIIEKHKFGSIICVEL